MWRICDTWGVLTTFSNELMHLQVTCTSVMSRRCWAEKLACVKGVVLVRWKLREIATQVMDINKSLVLWVLHSSLNFASNGFRCRATGGVVGDNATPSHSGCQVVIFFAKCCDFILLSEQLLLLIVDIALPGDVSNWLCSRLVWSCCSHRSWLISIVSSGLPRLAAVLRHWWPVLHERHSRGCGEVGPLQHFYRAQHQELKMQNDAI